MRKSLFATAIAGAALAAVAVVPVSEAGTVSACVSYEGVQYDQYGDMHMHEEESPLYGMNGGRLEAYNEGVATYSDDTASDGVCWYTFETAPELFN